MLDVIVAGAGPAGAIAALVLARRGARVLLVDREAFPRDKLCGDTLNPGALRTLSRLGLTGGPLDRARPLHGMLVTNRTRAVAGRYPDGEVGRVVVRRDLDAWLLDEAVRAGVRFESGLIVRGPLVEETSGVPLVRGVAMDRRGEARTTLRVPALVVIGADGRRSVLARAAGLVVPRVSPRRWAFGAYASGVEGPDELGEMHVRRHEYIGVARVADDLVNVCVVTGPGPRGPRPLDVILRAIGRDSGLARRFARARVETPVTVLGPLACDVRAPGVPGLLLAGDAAGFVDPMTGDGLHFAIRGGVLAAEEALRVLETGHAGESVDRLAAARHAAFGRKVTFNRWVRRFVESPALVTAAGWGAAVAPSVIGRVVRYAGDAA